MKMLAILPFSSIAYILIELFMQFFLHLCMEMLVLVGYG